MITIGLVIAVRKVVVTIANQLDVCDTARLGRLVQPGFVRLGEVRAW
jgi:hypothetical protein